MKKWIAFMLIFVLGLALIGCNGDDESNEVEVTGIDITGNQPTMNVGETMQLTAVIKPENATNKAVVWSSKNETVATVDQEGKVTAHNPGVVEIVATSKESNRYSKTVSIQVIQPIVYDDPVDIELVYSATEFTEGASIQLTAKVLPMPDPANNITGARQDVLWSSSDESVATVSTSGRVTGIAPGEVTITATVVANPELTESVKLKVNEYKEGEIENKPTGIQVFGETRVEEGVKIILQAIVMPSGVSQNVTWSSEDTSIATVDSRGVVHAIAAGKARIKVASNLDLSVFRIFEIDVIPAVDLPDRANLQGYHIKIMAAPHATHEHNPKDPNYPGNDRTAKLAAWEKVETLYNAVLEVVPFPDTAPWGQPRIDYIIAKANINQAETDIFVSTTDWIDKLAGGNGVVDVTAYYEKYGKNSMSPYVKAASTYKGKLYAMTTGNTGGSIVPYHGLFYNVNMLEELNLDNPAKLFNDGEWTWTKFDEYMRNVASVIGDGKTVIAGKPAGLFYGMVSAAGVQLVDPSNMRINFNHTYAVQAARIIRNLYTIDNMWGTNAWDQNMTTFNAGDTLFAVAEYWFVKDGGRFPENMWGVGTTRYGYVPFPYPDTMDKTETRVSYQGGAIYQMSSGREHAYPSGVTTEDIYRAFTDLFLITSELVLSDPEYDEEVLMRRAAEKKLDDPESINAIVFFKGNQVIWDPFFSMLPSWSHAGPMLDRIVTQGEDYNVVMTEFIPVFQARMMELYGTAA